MGESMLDGPKTTAHSPQSLLRPMRSVLRWGVLGGLVGLPAAVGIGYLIAAGPGAWGALLGFGISVMFFTITAGVAMLTARLQPQWLGLAVMGSWLLKLVGLIVVMAMLDSADFYDRGVFFGALLISTFGYLVMEALVVSRTRVLYVETEFAPAAASDPAAGRS